MWSYSLRTGFTPQDQQQSTLMIQTRQLGAFILISYPYLVAKAKMWLWAESECQGYMWRCRLLRKKRRLWNSTKGKSWVKQLSKYPGITDMIHTLTKNNFTRICQLTTNAQPKRCMVETQITTLVREHVAQTAVILENRSVLIMINNVVYPVHSDAIDLIPMTISIP